MQSARSESGPPGRGVGEQASKAHLQHPDEVSKGSHVRHSDFRAPMPGRYATRSTDRSSFVRIHKLSRVKSVPWHGISSTALYAWNIVQQCLTRAIEAFC